MGNFEKLSVLVIVVIIVMILVVAISALTSDPDEVDPGTSASLNQGEPFIKAENDYDMPNTEFPSSEPKPTDPIDNLDTPLIEDPNPPEPNVDSDDLAGNDLAQPTPMADDGLAQQERSHTVASGETLGEIAEKLLGSYRRYPEIIALNPGLRPEALRAGTVIKIPAMKGGSAVPPQSGGIASSGGAPAVPGSDYVIQSGDSLKRIAKRAYRNFEKWPDIWAANFNLIQDPNNLPVGTRIRLPR